MTLQKLSVTWLVPVCFSVCNTLSRLVWLFLFIGSTLLSRSNAWTIICTISCFFFRQLTSDLEALVQKRFCPSWTTIWQPNAKLDIRKLTVSQTGVVTILKFLIAVKKSLKAQRVDCTTLLEWYAPSKRFQVVNSHQHLVGKIIKGSIVHNFANKIFVAFYDSKTFVSFSFWNYKLRRRYNWNLKFRWYIWKKTWEKILSLPAAAFTGDASTASGGLSHNCKRFCEITDFARLAPKLWTELFPISFDMTVTI